MRMLSRSFFFLKNAEGVEASTVQADLNAAIIKLKSDGPSEKDKRSFFRFDILRCDLQAIHNYSYS